MAKTTNWIGADAVAPTDFTDADNWSNGVPVTGDTIGYLDSTVALPNTHLPNAGEVFAIVISGSAGGGWGETSITDFLGTGDWEYSSLTIVPGAGADDQIAINKDSAVGGTISVSGVVYAYGESNAFPNAIFTANDSGTIQCDLTNVSFSQKVTILAGGSLSVQDGVTVSLASMDLAGKLEFATTEGVVDAESAITCTGNASIDWAVNGATLYGGLNADGHTVTHTNTTGATLTCDVTGTLALGGAAVGLAINIEGTGITVTAGANISCGTLTLTEGTYVAAVTHTVATGQVLTVAGTSTLTLTDAGLDVNVTAGTCTLGGTLTASRAIVQTGATLTGAGNDVVLTDSAHASPILRHRITGYGTVTNIDPTGDAIHLGPGITQGAGNTNVVADAWPKVGLEM